NDAWEYPRCAVPIDRQTVAIAAGYPDDDGEALAAWSARIALALSRAHVRAAIVSGGEAARTELAAALSLVGVDVRDAATSDDSRGPVTRRRRWLRLPWR